MRNDRALLKYAGHLSDDQMQKLIEMTKEAMGVSKVLVVPDGVEISRLV